MMRKMQNESEEWEGDIHKETETEEKKIKLKRLTHKHMHNVYYNSTHIRVLYVCTNT